MVKGEVLVCIRHRQLHTAPGTSYLGEGWTCVCVWISLFLSTSAISIISYAALEILLLFSNLLCQTLSKMSSVSTKTVHQPIFFFYLSLSPLGWCLLMMKVQEVVHVWPLHSEPMLPLPQVASSLHESTDLISCYLFQYRPCLSVIPDFLRNVHDIFSLPLPWNRSVFHLGPKQYIQWCVQ